MDTFFNVLSRLNDFYWEYIGVWLLMGVGLYFTLRTKFFQLRVLEHLPASLKFLTHKTSHNGPGISPIKTLFASVGGMIGVGNIVAVTASLQIGGPGAIVWLWIGVILGTIIKYTETYIGIKYRRSIGDKGYEGSLMHAFPTAFRLKYWPSLGAILATIAGLLLCFYGIEIYQFTVITDTFMRCFSIEKREWITAILLGIIIYIGLGGTKRLSNVCSAVMPLMILFYVTICGWVFLTHFREIPATIGLILKSAFSGHAPLGGFVGSTILMVIQQGIAQGVYSSDIAVGFDSVLQSESRATDPRQQACVAVLGTITDAIICTCSFGVVLLSGFWKEGIGLSASDCVLKAFESYFKYGPYFLSLTIFLAGFTTIQAYFVVGLKSASFLSARWGKPVYFLVAAFNFWVFSYYEQTHILTLMRLASGLLILINLSCLFRLRKEVYYNLDGVFEKESSR